MLADIMEVMAEEITRSVYTPFVRHWTMDADYVELQRLEQARRMRNTYRAKPVAVRTGIQRARRALAKSRANLRKGPEARALAARIKAYGPHDCIFASGVCRCGRVRE